MATLETQKLDSIIASRRALLTGAAALAATVMVEKPAAAAIPATPTDTDILNFALNLEYLEANFYTIAVEGTSADLAATSKTSLMGGTQVTVAQAYAAPTGAPTNQKFQKVVFTSPAVAAYAQETAVEERKHVLFLQSALGSAAVAQPALNLNTSFTNLAGPLGLAAFNPFTNDLNFLYGSYIFEDVGVTAYHGGALAITNKGKTAATSPDYLTPAAQIMAVEAYHSGLIRTVLAQVDAGIVTIGGGGQGTAIGVTTAISNARAMADGTLGTAPASTDTVGLTGQDDFGLATYSVQTNGTTGTASRILDQGRTTTPFYSNFIAFKRSLAQVLAVVYGSTATNPTFSATSFFPAGMNGNIK